MKKLLFVTTAVLFVIVAIIRLQILIFDFLNQSAYVSFFKTTIYTHLPNLFTVLACIYTARGFFKKG